MSVFKMIAVTAVLWSLFGVLFGGGIVLLGHWQMKHFWVVVIVFSVVGICSGVYSGVRLQMDLNEIKKRKK